MSRPGSSAGSHPGPSERPQQRRPEARPRPPPSWPLQAVVGPFHGTLSGARDCASGAGPVAWTPPPGSCRPSGVPGARWPRCSQAAQATHLGGVQGDTGHRELVAQTLGVMAARLGTQKPACGQPWSRSDPWAACPPQPCPPRLGAASAADTPAPRAGPGHWLGHTWCLRAGWAPRSCPPAPALCPGTGSAVPAPEAGVASREAGGRGCHWGYGGQDWTAREARAPRADTRRRRRASTPPPRTAAGQLVTSTLRGPPCPRGSSCGGSGRREPGRQGLGERAGLSHELCLQTLQSHISTPCELSRGAREGRRCITAHGAGGQDASEGRRTPQHAEPSSLTLLVSSYGPGGSLPSARCGTCRLEGLGGSAGTQPGWAPSPGSPRRVSRGEGAGPRRRASGRLWAASGEAPGRHRRTAHSWKFHWPQRGRRAWGPGQRGHGPMRHLHGAHPSNGSVALTPGPQDGVPLGKRL